MMKEFLWVLAIIFNIEGGWTTIDGGTKYGITAATLQQANTYNIVQTRHVRNLTRRDASLIYYKMYWLPSKANRYAYPLNLAIFDAAVHLGPTKARELLYKTLRSSYSNLTPQQAKNVTPRIVARRFVVERYQHLQTLKRFSTYGTGWRRRMQKILYFVKKDRKANWKGGK